MKWDSERGPFPNVCDVSSVIISRNRTTGILKISPKASSKSSISARSGTPTKIHSEQDTKRMEVSYCTPLDHEIAMVLSPVGSVC